MSVVAAVVAYLMLYAPEKRLVVPPDERVCVTVSVDTNLAHTYDGSAFDISGQLAYRLDLAFLEQKGHFPPALKDQPARKFIIFTDDRTYCAAPNRVNIRAQYSRLPNGQPYRLIFSISNGADVVVGTFDEDLSLRDGLGEGFLDSPRSPTLDLINHGMTRHARFMLDYLEV